MRCGFGAGAENGHLLHETIKLVIFLPCISPHTLQDFTPRSAFWLRCCCAARAKHTPYKFETWAATVPVPQVESILQWS
jgi:hypothetical protein